MTDGHEELVSGTTRSLWMDVEMPKGEAQLPDESSTGVVVVGAGITGLTTAYLLARFGEKVIVLDAGPIGGRETMRTTAHLTCAIDDRYEHIESLHGTEGARLAGQSHVHAIDTIERIVLAEKIDCGFRRIDGLLYLGEGDRRELLEREAAAARRAGIDVELLESPPGAPLSAGPALRFPRQADINPMKYLAGLATAIERMGGHLYSGCHVEHFEGGAAPFVRVAGGKKVSARAVVVATNTPVNNRVVIHTKQVAFRTYAMTFDVPRGVIPPVLAWDTGTPYHYVRLDHTMAAPDRELLIVGGEDHRTGQDFDPTAHWERLEAWARARFLPAGEVMHRWSGQVLEPVDGLAFIGKNPMDAPGVYVATGDSGQGMTYGTIAAVMFAQLLEGREHPYTKLYDPRRRTLRALPALARDALNVAAQYADWVRPGDVEGEHLIPDRTGATLLEHGHRLAVYRDEHGRCHRFRAACTHLGGVVAWNEAEKSWDCPCHGARFDALGRVIAGPAIADLEKYDEPEGDEAPEISSDVAVVRA